MISNLMFIYNIRLLGTANQITYFISTNVDLGHEADLAVLGESWRTTITAKPVWNQQHECRNHKEPQSFRHGLQHSRDFLWGALKYRINMYSNTHHSPSVSSTQTNTPPPAGLVLLHTDAGRVFYELCRVIYNDKSPKNMFIFVMRLTTSWRPTCNICQKLEYQIKGGGGGGEN